jgi:glycosyltransferase involved in cell wall biosynthesis
LIVVHVPARLSRKAKAPSSNQIVSTSPIADKKPPATTKPRTLAAKPRNLTPLDPATLRLSVLVPVYNELHTIETILSRVHATPLAKEIICVDDCSTDGTREKLVALREEGYIDTLILQPVNGGKGRAIRTALAASTGDVVIVQDADLEYDPQDWPVLLEPIVDGKADACFGSRFLGGPHRVLYYWHSVGNTWLTRFSNMLTNLNLTDMETCYKAIRGDLARSLTLTSDRFGFEPEITARLAHRDARIYEVPISYAGRTYAEGKKINWKDGVAAFWHILKFSMRR